MPRAQFDGALLRADAPEEALDFLAARIVSAADVERLNREIGVAAQGIKAQVPASVGGAGARDRGGAGPAQLRHRAPRRSIAVLSRLDAGQLSPATGDSE